MRLRKQIQSTTVFCEKRSGSGAELAPRSVFCFLSPPLGAMAVQSLGLTNETASILPRELIWAIFDYLPLRPDLIRVSHVSQRWRELARTHSSFWRDVDLRDSGFGDCSYEYDLMTAQLRASEATCTGLDLRIDINREAEGWTEPSSEDDWEKSLAEDLIDQHPATPMKCLLDLSVLLKDNAHRIAQLRLKLSPMVLGSLIDAHFFDMPAPLLVELEVITHETRSWRRCPFDWSCICRAPKLRVLRLNVDLDAEAYDKSLSISHGNLEELTWEPIYDGDIQVPSVDVLLDLFPRLRFLNLPTHLRQQDFKDPAAASARIACFHRLGLPNQAFNLLDVARLTHVPHLYVHDSDLVAIHGAVSHFLQDAQSERDHKSLHSRQLYLQLWPWHVDSWLQPMMITDLSPNGRVRAFGIAPYTQLREVSAMQGISNMVTRLALPIREWEKFIEVLDGAPAVHELAILVSSSYDGVYFQEQPRIARSTKLRRVVLQASQKAHAPAETVDLFARDFASFIKRAIDPSMWRQMDLVIEGVNWIEDVGCEEFGTAKELLEPFFSNFEVEPDYPTSGRVPPSLNSTERAT